MEFKDYYQVLGVERDASAEDIKRAYRKLARKYHPDVSKEANAEEQFKAVNEANEALKDPEKRAAYDQLSRQQQAGEQFQPPPGWESNFNRSGAEYAGDGAQFSDFLTAFLVVALSDTKHRREISMRAWKLILPTPSPVR